MNHPPASRVPSRPQVPIAGPPRVRHVAAVSAPPPSGGEPSVVVPADVAMPGAQPHPSASPAGPAVAPVRALPPLDYDEWSRGTRRRLEATSPSRRALRGPRRWMWFAAGLALGVAAAAALHDDAVAGLREARVWCAGRLRSLESPHGVPLTSASSVTVTVSSSPPPVSSGYGPMPSVAMYVPTVRAEDLPRAKPPVVYRPRPRVAAAAPVPAPSPTDPESGEVTPLPGSDDDSPPSS